MYRKLMSMLRVSTLTVVMASTFQASNAWAESTFTPEVAAANTAVATKFYSLINGGDPVVWRQGFADGWTAHPPLSAEGSTVEGYEVVIGAFRAGFPELKVENIEVIANEDVVAVRSLVTGTNTAPLFGQPPTGKKVSFTAMDIHRIQDGRIVETWHVEDFLTMAAQLKGN